MTAVITDREERRVHALAEGLRRALEDGRSDTEMGVIVRAVLDGPHREDEHDEAAEPDPIHSLFEPWN
jgi:hypothetical protein